MKRKDTIKQIQTKQFVGRAKELEVFKALLPLEREDNIAIIHVNGPTGIGKTILLDQFEEICKKESVPFARVNLIPRPPTESIDFVANVFQQLISAKPGVALKKLRKQLEHYQKLEGKVLQSKTDIPGKKADLTAKVVKAGLALSPLGPLNVLMEVVGDDLISGGVQALYGLFNNPGDIECYLNPLPFFTKDLVLDINEYPSRIVFFIDNYECASQDLDNWLRDYLFAETESNILFVIAGRQPKLIGEWEHWVPQIYKMTLPSLNDYEMRKYLADRNVVKPEMQEAIINYSGGNPYVMNIAADLSIRTGNGIDILEKYRSELVNDMVRKLTEEIVVNLNQNLKIALEASSVVRFFTEELLQDLVNLDNPREIYEELSTLSFVHPNSAGAGLMLDPVSRHFVEVALSLRAPARHKHLHELAVKAFDARLEYAGVYDRPRFQVEKLYHLLRVDQEAAMSFFEDLFIRAVRLHNLQFCDSLLAEVKDSSVELIGNMSVAVVRFCQAELLQKRRKLQDARVIYEELLENSHLLPLLHLRTIAGLSLMLRDHEPALAEKYELEGLAIWEKIKPDGARYAVQVIHDLADVKRDSGKVLSSLPEYEKSVELSKQFGYKFGEMDGLHGLGIALRMIGRFDESIQILQQAIGVSREIHDENGEGSILHNLAMAYFMKGDYVAAERCINDAIPLLEKWGNQFGLVVAKYKLARVYRANFQHERALEAIESGLDILHTKGSSYYESESYIRKAEVLLDMERYDDALNALNISKAIAKQHSYFQWLSEIYLLELIIILRKDLVRVNPLEFSSLLENFDLLTLATLQTALKHNVYFLHNQADRLFDELGRIGLDTPNAICRILKFLEEEWNKSEANTQSLSNLENDLCQEEKITKPAINTRINNLKNQLKC